VSRFHPQYRERDIPATNGQALIDVRQVGVDAGLYYVYTGNLAWNEGEQTMCPSCGYHLINRSRYMIAANNIVNGQCPECGYTVDGLEM